MDETRIAVQPIDRGSVVDLAYRRIKTLIEDGEIEPSARLRQGDLADALAISRTSVREALHRLTGDDLVVFETNRGFFVASFHLDAVLERLEVRLVLEPGLARLASERRTKVDLSDLGQIVKAQRDADTSRLAHDMSREFHIRLARTTRNEQAVRVLESLWSLDLGRRLLARRMATPGWQEGDAAEHDAILEAVAARDAERAASLMEQHVAATHQHWSKGVGSHSEESAVPGLRGTGHATRTTETEVRT